MERRTGKREQVLEWMRLKGEAVKLGQSPVLE